MLPVITSAAPWLVRGASWLSSAIGGTYLFNKFFGETTPTITPGNNSVQQPQSGVNLSLSPLMIIGLALGLFLILKKK